MTLDTFRISRWRERVDPCDKALPPKESLEAPGDWRLTRPGKFRFFGGPLARTKRMFFPIRAGNQHAQRPLQEFSISITRPLDPWHISQHARFRDNVLPAAGFLKPFHPGQIRSFSLNLGCGEGHLKPGQFLAKPRIRGGHWNNKRRLLSNRIG